MSSIGRMSILDAIDLHLRRWKRSYDSRRKVILAGLLAFLFLMYFASGISKWMSSSRHGTIDYTKTALEELLRPFASEEASLNTFITRSWIRSQNDIHVSIPGSSSGNSLSRPSTTSLAEDMIAKNFHPFVGNGKFGLDMPSARPSLGNPVSDLTKTGIWIKGRRGLDHQFPFHPLVQVDPVQEGKETVTVLRVKEGVVHRITTFPYVTTTASIFETIYAHRLISSLMVQEVRVSNPSEVPLILRLSREGWQGRPSVRRSKFQVSHHDFSSGHEQEYDLIEGEIRSLEGNLVNGFVISAPVLEDTLEVPSRGKSSVVWRTFVNYTKATPPGRISHAMTDLKESVKETTKKVTAILSTTLLQYHTKAWHNLWKTGFSISLSKAGDGVVNGDDINCTMYYILSQKESFASDVNLVSPTSIDFIDSRSNFLLNHPDRCYAGNPTLQAPNLWTSLSDSESVQRVVSLWLLTLEKNGCGNLLSAGAEGTLQAVILSFVSMQFHQNHLEMGIHPKELHRDYFLRRVRYSNTTSINVTMTVGEDYKASIYVSLDKNTGNKDFFACDAGCLDTPVKLSLEKEIQFPVKITEPLTPILYITHDRQHVLELKHAIHVKEVAVAPAHETHIIALHRHGHQLGGLPTFFWMLLFILVVLFHVFLAKLIYNEYFGGASSSSYSSSGSSTFSYERLRRAV